MKFLLGLFLGAFLTYAEFTGQKSGGLVAAAVFTSTWIIRSWFGDEIKTARQDVYARLEQRGGRIGRLLAFWTHHRQKHPEFDVDRCSSCQSLS